MMMMGKLLKISWDKMVVMHCHCHAKLPSMEGEAEQVVNTVGFIKNATIKGSIIGGRVGYFVATFGLNNTPIYMSKC